MNFQTIAITGHRDLRPADGLQIKVELRKQLLAIKNDLGEFSILIGNAAGADQLALEIIQELQEAKKLDIKIIDLDKACPREANEKNDCYYARQADFIITHSDIIIAIWDGIFTHKPGGTSDIVYKAIESGKKLTIHHLICPRVSNPYPVASLLGDVIDFENKKFKRIPFAIHFSCLEIELPFSKTNTKASWFQKLSSGFRSSVFWVYVLPILLVIATLSIGILGFAQKNQCDTSLNHLFNTVNLLTLNGSVIENGSNGLIDTSRILGLFLVIIAFSYAFYNALTRQRQDFVRWFWQLRGNFVLILGLNEKSYDLIDDLCSAGTPKRNVVVLNPNQDSIYEDEVKKKSNIIVVNGNLFSGRMLKKLYLHKAAEVYVLSESDTDNIRATQEIDLLSTQYTPSDKVDHFVHIADDAKKKFLQKSIHPALVQRTNIFNVYENTIRRLLLYYPIDRFYQSPKAKHAHAVIIGFDDLGKQLVLTLLKQGHYTRDKYLHLHVICKDAALAKEKFLAAYPQFSINAFTGKVQNSEGVLAYTWQNIQLSFEEMPNAEIDWLSNENSIFKNIDEEHIISIYACLANGIESATYLSIILPKIDFLKHERKCNLQVFCYYNFPDKKEEAIIEKQFNKLAPHTHIACFGNFIDEYSCNAIHNMSLDALPKLINANYSGIEFSNPVNQKEIETQWQALTEKDKSSSRQAADHLWVKIRLIWPEIDWQFNPKTFELYDEVKSSVYEQPKLNEYAEIEHRRWCADLLLAGFKPIVEDIESEQYTDLAQRWNSSKPEDKAMKKAYQARFEHIDLVPFDKLLHHEAEKDRQQLEAISGFLRAIVKTD